jgi:hypothetical protein
VRRSRRGSSSAASGPRDNEAASPCEEEELVLVPPPFVPPCPIREAIRATLSGLTPSSRAPRPGEVIAGPEEAIRAAWRDGSPALEVGASLRFALNLAQTEYNPLLPAGLPLPPLP